MSKRKIIYIISFAVAILIVSIFLGLKKADSYAGNGPIGFVGCSVTHNAVDGYISLGGRSFWMFQRNSGQNYSGGSLLVWYNQLANPASAREKDYWGIFKSYLRKYPNTKKIWWEICSSDIDNVLNYGNAVSVLNEIKRLAPAVEIYVTPSPIFPDTFGGPCADPSIVNGFVDGIIGEGTAKTGPVMTPLGKAYIADNGCHANTEGQVIWGNDLKNFFGI
jgi:hypothetical protein